MKPSLKTQLDKKLCLRRVVSIPRPFVAVFNTIKTLKNLRKEPFMKVSPPLEQDFQRQKCFILFTGELNLP